MSLQELLKDKGIQRALIVDDVCDATPTAGDIDPGNEAWPTFNDDLTVEQKEQIFTAYPPAREARFDDLVASDEYVAAIWRLRGTLGAVSEPLFANYLADQASDQRFVDLARAKLEDLGLHCETRGRDFADATQGADLILIDLFFNKAQDEEALAESKVRLRDAIMPRAAAPPLVILMSRSPRLDAKREEFRDDVGLIDSAFRIIKKSDLEQGNRLEQLIERLAENAEDSARLAQYFAALEAGMVTATSRTLSLLRKLRLSDIGQIQQLLLNVEGEPAGSYLVDIFDRVLQHEIEGEKGIIDAAVALNKFSAAKYPPPYIAGSPDLQELVQRLLTQNEDRLRLPGASDAVVTFGDVLVLSEGADIGRLKQTLLVDMAKDKVFLVLTPVCDLQRGGAPRILLLVGEFKKLDARSWSYGDDARTSAIRIEGTLGWIKWQLKHIDTVARDALDEALGNNDLKVSARLREAHALEIQQRVLAGLGRVGLVADLPGTFPVEVEAYFAGLDGRPTRLEVAALAEGAVCFVGREADGSQALRLVVTESGCDDLIQALAQIPEARVAEAARTAFGHVNSTTDLQHMLVGGVSLKNTNDKGWWHIPSSTGAGNNIPKMGLLAWNYAIPNETLANKDLNKAGIILLVRDSHPAHAPGLGDAIRSGLVEPAPIPLGEDDSAS